MQGIMRLKEAIERHRENKDINLKYKTPLTSELCQGPCPLPQHSQLTLDRLSSQQRHFRRRTTNTGCL